MMGEECCLPQDVSTAELHTNREQDISPHPFATWVRDALEVAYDYVRESLHMTVARRKRLYDIKTVNRKFPIGSWVLRYCPPAAQHKLGSPWIGPNQVVRQATGYTVGIQRDPENPIVFVHVDDLKLYLRPEDVRWTAGVPSLCASMVAFRPGSHVSDIASTPSVDLSGWEDVASHHSRRTAVSELARPIDLTRLRFTSETSINWTVDFILLHI